MSDKILNKFLSESDKDREILSAGLLCWRFWHKANVIQILALSKDSFSLLHSLSGLLAKQCPIFDPLACLFL